MRRFIFFVAAVSLSLFSACAVLSGSGAEFRNAQGLFEEKRYSEAAASYRKALNEYPDSSRAADARFGLAYTLAYYDNPQKDYAQALQEFEEFIKLYPRHKKATQAQDWRQVLKALVETKKENERLNKNIEELKKLDIRHEEKRKMR